MKKMIKVNELNSDNFAGAGDHFEIDEVVNKDIAIIGISLRMPSANNQDEFWEIIKNGIDCTRQIPNDRREDIEWYLKKKYGESTPINYLQCSYLDDISGFDYKYFGFSPKEAKLINPIQRIFMETACNAIEDAGYGGNMIKGSNTGIFLGLASDLEWFKYREMIQETLPEYLSMSMSGNLASMTPSRISYLFDLKGPTMLIDTACSSSLMAVHKACQSNP